MDIKAAAFWKQSCEMPRQQSGSVYGWQSVLSGLVYTVAQHYLFKAGSSL